MASKTKAPKTAATKKARQAPAQDTPAEPAVQDQPTTAGKKPAKKAKAAKPTTRKLSALTAAAKVLAEDGRPMTAKEMVEAMATKGYWTSPGGKTPHATLYAAIIREIATKGSQSRFRKTDRGLFAAAAPASTDPADPAPKARKGHKGKTPEPTAVPAPIAETSADA